MLLIILHNTSRPEGKGSFRIKLSSALNPYKKFNKKSCLL